MVLIHDIPGGIYINVKYGVLCMYVCIYIIYIYILNVMQT
jgi:hypothetical protein